MRRKDIKFYDVILEEIRNNSKVTETYLAFKYLVTERTVRRYIKDLKDNEKIKLVGSGTIKEWKIL